MTRRVWIFKYLNALPNLISIVNGKNGVNVPKLVGLELELDSEIGCAKEEKKKRVYAIWTHVQNNNNNFYYT